MESKAKVLGHPIHPMLIVFPLGLLAAAVAFDIVGLAKSDVSWFGISYWMIAAGIIGVGARLHGAGRSRDRAWRRRGQGRMQRRGHWLRAH